MPVDFRRCAINYRTPSADKASISTAVTKGDPALSYLLAQLVAPTFGPTEDKYVKDFKDLSLAVDLQAWRALENFRH
jgi:hypothetical protein